MTSDFIEIIYDDDWNIIGAKKYFPSGPSVPAPNPELATIVYLAPQFKLGASTEDPSLGTGGALAWYTKEVFTNGTRIDLQVFVENIGGSAGVGTGSYELFLPEEITPPEDYYSDNAAIWIAGGEISDFDGSMKWNDDDGKSKMKLIFTFEGFEWSKSRPKTYNNFKLRANIRYFL